jgi:mono/diheme cytochrome c family protein
MRASRLRVLLVVMVLAALGYYGARLIWRGFSTADQPSYLERTVARAARNLSIPRKARLEENPLKATPDVLKEARERFVNRCAVCHGVDGTGRTDVGQNLYPKVPDLRATETQRLTDGEIRYIIRNGVRLTGMPGWARPHDEQSDDSWKLVVYIRSLQGLTAEEQTQQFTTIDAARYVGSAQCAKCHREIYEHWRKTPMANVVRDPREHPEAIIPDLTTDLIAHFKKEDVAFVYGSVWKQRYFTKIGDDYFRSLRSGTSRIEYGGHISWRIERTGGRRCIRKTTCRGRQGRPAMAAIRWTTTYRRNRWRSGMWDAKSAMGQAASTWRTQHGETF